MIFYANTGDGEKAIGQGDKAHVDVAISQKKSERLVSLTFGDTDNENKVIGFDEVVSISFSYDEFLSFIERVNQMRDRCEQSKRITEQYDVGNDDA